MRGNRDILLFRQNVNTPPNATSCCPPFSTARSTAGFDYLAASQDSHLQELALDAARRPDAATKRKFEPPHILIRPRESAALSSVPCRRRRE